MSIARAKVWNDWTQEHVEMFKGEEIRIPAKGFIEMGWSEAVQLKGQFSPILRDGTGRDLKPKMIRLEKISVASAEPEKAKFICQMDGKEFSSQKELDEYIAANHIDKLVDDDTKKELKDRVAKTKRS